MVLGIVPVLFMLMPSIGHAHPHVFIAQNTRVLFDEKGMAEIKIRWTFDEMFSVMILEDFDSNRDKVLDTMEIQTIKEKAFGYIASHNYYIHIKIDNKPFEVKFIKDFNARVENGKLVYEFTIPCHVTAIATPKKIMISPYDPEYYSAIYFPDQQSVSFENQDRYEITSAIDIDRSTLFFHETVNPYALFLTFKIKS